MNHKAPFEEVLAAFVEHFDRMRAVTEAHLAPPGRSVLREDAAQCGLAQKAERDRFAGVLAAASWDKDEFWTALRKAAVESRKR